MVIDRYEGFDEFVVARGQALSRTAFLLTCDHGAAEDLLQNALASAAARWSKLRDSSPEAYVRKTLYHEYISAWRRSQRRLRELLVPVVHDYPSVDESDDVATRLAVSTALAALPPRQRAVLVLRYFEDLTEVQTAEVLRIGVGTVKSHTRDALARLRTQAPDLAQLIGRPASSATQRVARGPAAPATREVAVR